MNPTSDASTNGLLEAALNYWEAGLTPLPHVAGIDGTSYIGSSGGIEPVAWSRYKEYQPSRADIVGWFQYGNCATVRLELLAGSGPQSKYDVQARLQILDFESAAVFEAFLEDVHWSGHSNILHRCVIERTPSGGAHLGFLCQAMSEQPKLKLALTTDETGHSKILIELLQHHLCTVAPTQVAWKPDRPLGATYHLTQGSWAHPYVISAEQREMLIATCKSLNEVPEAVIEGHRRVTGSTARPGDLLNTQAGLPWWQDLLSRHGWREVTRPHHARQGMAAFQRPGKVGFHLSATYGKTGAYLYVFSSNAQPFEPDRGYSPFAAYALLDHDGNFAAASQALAPPDQRPSGSFHPLATRLSSRLATTIRSTL